MLAIKMQDYDKYGCPNCGCDKAIVDSCYCTNEPGVTCRSCKLHFQVISKYLEKPTTKFGTDRKDENGNTIMEQAIVIPHPRNGIDKWHWEVPDIRPKYGEYWNPRGIGYDLSGFVKSKQAGERLLEMVKKVLHKENPESWLDYRESEPEWIQFKFQKSEFDLDKLMKLVNNNHQIITEEILVQSTL